MTAAFRLTDEEVAACTKLAYCLKGRMSSKNNLQELLQKRSCQLPKYEQLERSGPAHKPSFTCKVTVKWTDDNTYQEEGSGTKKAEAEKEAAKKMLDKLVLVEKSKPSQVRVCSK